MDGGVRAFGWIVALVVACACGAPAGAASGGATTTGAGDALPSILRIDAADEPGAIEQVAGEGGTRGAGDTSQGVGAEVKRGSTGAGQDEASTTELAVTTREDLPLGVVNDEGGTGFGNASASPMGGLGLLRTIGAVVVVVLLIIAARVIIARTARVGGGGIRAQLGAGGHAPSGILQILGRYPVARGQTLVLLKLDRRVLLLSQTSAGFSTLTEITDADDVASILSKSRDDEGESLSARFGALLRRLERDPAMGSGDDVEIAPYLRRPSLDEVDGFDDSFAGAGPNAASSADPDLATEDPGEALRRRLEGLRGLSA